MTLQSARARREAIEQYGPAPTTPTEALAHVVAVWDGEPDDRVMIDATTNVYGDRIRTGLTLGDLRALAAKLAAVEALLPPVEVDRDPTLGVPLASIRAALAITA